MLDGCWCRGGAPKDPGGGGARQPGGVDDAMNWPATKVHARFGVYEIRVWSLRFGVWGLGFGVWGLGFKALG
jgi:hypothetical protein